MDCAIIHKAKSGGTVNGDAYFISAEAPWFLMIADGLGSGEKARSSANIPLELAGNYCLDAYDSIEKRLQNYFLTCHQKLRHSRGAAVGGVLLDFEKHLLTFCGVGNIRLVVAGGKRKCVSGQPGIVGVQMPRRITVNQFSTESYATGFLFSDGISVRSVLRAATMPGRPVQLMAEEIDRLNGNSDDRTLLVFSTLF